MRIRYWSSDVCSSDLFGSQPRPELDERHARSGNPLSPRPSRRCFGGHAPRAQLEGKSFAETIELNRTRIDAVAIQPLGLNQIARSSWREGVRAHVEIQVEHVYINKTRNNNNI